MGHYDVMLDNSLKGVAFKGYKSYQDITRFFFADNITLLVGKNNAGKSSVLDVIEYLIDNDKKDKPRISNLIGLFCFDVNHVREGVSGRDIHLAEDFITRNTFFKKQLYYPINIIENEQIKQSEILDVYDCSSNNELYLDGIDYVYKQNLSTYKVLRLNADRNIIPELEDIIKKDEFINSNGDGATNLLRAYIVNGK